MRQRTVCDRNGCERVATRLLTWDFYQGTTKACDEHARWWRRGSVGHVVVEGIAQ